MADHPNAARYREVTKALNAGDMEAMMAAMNEHISDDIEWWSIGSPEPARGKQALMESFAAFGDGDINVDLHDVVANDEHLIALVNATATINGRTLKYRTAEIHHVKDGKITHRWAFSDDTDAIIKFFG